MCVALTSQLRCTRTNARPNDASTAASDRSMSNVPCVVCTNVSRSAASNAQISCGSRNTRLRLRRATMRGGPARRRAARRRPPLVQPAQALHHALFAERLEQVVDDAELERLERVLLVRRREDEHRRVRRRPATSRTSVSPLSPRPAPSSAHVDEDDVDARRRARRSRAPGAPRRALPPRRRPRRAATTRAARPGSCARATRPRRRARGAECGHGHRGAQPRAAAISTIDRVPCADDSRRSDALGASSSSRRRTAWRPNAPARTSRVGHPGAVVLDDAHERPVGAARRPHDDLARAVAAAERAVLDRVLDERLEKQARQERRLALGRHVPREAKRPVVPRLEDLRVAPEPGDLLVEALQLAGLLDRVAQQIAQAHEQAPRLARVFGHEAGDRVERVEQEVRLEVRPQARELGLRCGAAAPRARARPRSRPRTGRRTPSAQSAEVELRVERRRRAPSAGRLDAVRKVQAQLGHVAGDDPVEEAEGAADRRRDARRPPPRPLGALMLPANRPAKRAERATSGAAARATMKTRRATIRARLASGDEVGRRAGARMTPTTKSTPSARRGRTLRGTRTSSATAPSAVGRGPGCLPVQGSRRRKRTRTLHRH